MVANASWYAHQLRLELCLRNRHYARGRVHVESYGSLPVIVYAPCEGRHGNFFDAAYEAILARPDWLRRFDKVHAQARRSLPKFELDHTRRWRELDSSMSSDALLMNIFCSPGVAASRAVQNALGVEAGSDPSFGWKARVPLANGRFDRTEVDMRFGSLLVEAKLTEGDFQTREAGLVESYHDFDTVFDRGLLPRAALVLKRRRTAEEFPEAFSQEFESVVDTTEEGLRSQAVMAADSPSFVAADAFNAALPCEAAYASYQLIRNVLAAHATGSSFCVLHDQRRPDLCEAWFQIMAAVKDAELRTRLKVLTWQELAALLPEGLQQFLDMKYGIVAPGKTPSAVDDAADF